MDLKDLGLLVAKDAPLVGSLITPFNPLVGTIITELGHIFNADANNPEDVFNKIMADPNAKEKLQEMEQSHQESMLKLQVEDRESARQREEEVVKVTGKRDWVLDIIAILVVLGFFVMCIIVAMEKLDQSDHDILYMLIGQLTAGFLMVISYYFGSSNKQN